VADSQPGQPLNAKPIDAWAIQRRVRAARQAEPTHVRIVAAGFHLPGEPVSTEAVEARVAAASPGQRIRRGTLFALTGIQSRHYLSDQEQASDLAVAAARQALDRAGATARDIDLLVWGSASQDLVEPATAHIVADKLGLACPVFDVKNACNSFLNGLQVAVALLASRSHRTALVVTGESPSRAIRWSVDSAASFALSAPGYTMGDAGAAVLLTYDDDCEGVFFQEHRAWSHHWSVATLPGGGSMHPRGDEWTYFSGDGRRLRDTFLAIGPGLFSDALAATDLSYADFAAICCHQVTLPFLELFCRQTGIPIERVALTLPATGNIASATIPTQLAMALAEGRLQRGDRVMLAGLAGGLSMGVMFLTL
jgi:3-oxoacyl-[acyl-carrier-protein] synthase-3